jgi:ribonucleoside-diphosphate reductase alpha chain
VSRPFTSGGLSKKFNFHSSTTHNNVDILYRRSWQKGVKCFSIYRDGSKLSQPLSARLREIVEAPANVEKVAAKLVRHRLPSRRHGTIQKARLGGHTVYLHTGEYEDGRLGEIFIDMHKEGAAFRSMCHSFAIAISLGLQYGVSLEEYVEAYVGMRFDPSGPVQLNDNIKWASSMVDYFFKELAITYLGRTDLINQPEEEESPHTTMGPGEFPNGDAKSIPAANGSGKSSRRYSEDDLRQARQRGYLGDPCASCGQLTLLRMGSCVRCDQCHATSGCVSNLKTRTSDTVEDVRFPPKRFTFCFPIRRALSA